MPITTKDIPSYGDYFERGEYIDLAPGYYAKVQIKHDEDSREPWKECDGNIVGIRTASRNFTGYISKAPGERILHKGNRNERDYVYDFNASLEVAIRDGWGVEGSEGLTPKQIAVKSVEKNAEWIRRWLDNQWYWIGVCVEVFRVRPGTDELDRDGDCILDESLWSIESEGDYWKEVVIELIGKCVENDLSDRREAWLAALREAREVRYWAARDVVTA